jgi:hypothetical protein
MSLSPRLRGLAGALYLACRPNAWTYWAEAGLWINLHVQLALLLAMGLQWAND